MANHVKFNRNLLSNECNLEIFQYLAKQVSKLASTPLDFDQNLNLIALGDTFRHVNCRTQKTEKFL